jgi:hypothetical protein
MSQQMQSLEFDIDECIRAVLDALTYAQNYPRSFDTDVVLLHEQHNVHALSTHDVQILNSMMRLLYDRVYQALCSMHMYDLNGRCYYEHFTTDHGNILLWTEPFVQPPST